MENARWGPIIKFGKKIVRIPKKADDTKYTAEELKDMPLEEVKKIIEKEIPGAFEKKKAVKKKAAPKKKKKE